MHLAFPVLSSLAALLLTACNTNGSGTDPAAEGSAPAPAIAATPQPPVDPMASHDPVGNQPVPPEARDDRPRPLMQAQVVLDRMGYSPGVVEGTDSPATRNALRAFQAAMGLPQSGKLDAATQESLAPKANIPATRVVTIPVDFAAGPFQPLPKDPQEQAKLPALGYASLEEKLAERFHTTPATLRALNPPAPGTPPQPYAAGQRLRVPNVGADATDPGAVEDPAWRATLAMLGVGTAQSQAARIVVSKAKGTLQAFDGEGNLVGAFTVTTGSVHDPLPLGTWKINGIGHNPEFHYNPELFWDVSDARPKALLPPGPNNPVGVVWIDLSKPHYGIHGTPEPGAIGHSESHGCVRLTNWDAARLAQMVSAATRVDFVA